MPLEWPPKKYDSREEYASYAKIYDLLYNAWKDDIPFYLKCTAQYGSPVLELGCGTGRLTQPLAEAGYAVVGVDNSPEMLELCHKRVRGRLQELVTLVENDIRTLTLDQQFSLVIAPFTMFGHVLTDRDRLQTLKRIRHHVAPGGAFVMDDVTAAWAKSRADRKLYLLNEWLGDLIDPKTKHPLRVLSNYVRDGQRSIIARYDFVDWLEGDKIFRRIKLRVTLRYASAEHTIRLLNRAGFHKVSVLGYFDGSPYDFEHPQQHEWQIFIAR